MIRGFFHPRFKQLNRFADQELSGRKRERVAAHLAHCARCRETVRFVRGLSGSAAEIRVAGPPADALDRILRRRAEGDRVILPIAAPGSTPSRVKRAGPYAAASVLVIVAAGLVTVASLQADRSELRLEPSAPLAGSEISAEYHGSMFDGEERLRLRGEYHYADGRMERVTAAELIPDDGGARSGSFRLPDSVVYALFAVEDVDALRVDSNQRRLWELLAYEEDGRPVFKALAAKMDDIVDWDWAAAHEAAREMVDLYPEKVESWDRLLSMDRPMSSLLSQSPEAPEAHREQFRAFEEQFQQKSRVEADDLAALYYYARRVGDPVADFWRERLASEAPGHPRAVQIRVSTLGRELSDRPSRLLASMEELWRAFGPVHAEIALTGFQAATRGGDPQEIRKWARRYVDLQPGRRFDVASALLDIPSMRDEAMQWLREEVREPMGPDHAGRFLIESMSAYEMRRSDHARTVLVAIGEALVTAGEIEAGLDSIGLAMEDGWDPDLFRTAADVYLAAGDTAAAASTFARIAADPVTSPAFSDSIRSRLRHHFPDEDWRTLVEHARDAMRQHVLAQAELRYLPDDLPLVGGDGSLHYLRELSRGEVAVVAFWSRYSPYALGDVPQLRRLSDDLETHGVSLISITEEMPSRGFDRITRELQVDFPMYHDVNGVARRAFSQWSWPAYYVVDSSGRIRFVNSSLDVAEIRRQVATLQLTEQMPTLAM